MNSRRFMSAPSSGDGILAAKVSNLIALKPASGALFWARPMTALGHSRPGRTSIISSNVRYAFDRYRNGEALKPTRRAHKATYAVQQKTSLFDHLVGERQERLGDRQAERLGGLEVDDQVELGRLLDRDVVRLSPAKNLIDHLSGAPE